LFDGDPFRAGHCAAADGRRVLRDCPRQPGGEIGVARVKSKKRHHCPEEIFDVRGLCLLPTADIGRSTLCVAFRGPFDV
jgi:hypothetical protein